MHTYIYICICIRNKSHVTCDMSAVTRDWVQEISIQYSVFVSATFQPAANGSI